MVDLISTRTIDVTKMALDGLMMRQKAITANTANAMTPDYQRKEVNFEGQLREIIEKDDLKTYIKERNSIEYNPSSIDMAMGVSQGLTPQEARYLKSDIYSSYNPQITDDFVSGGDATGNNVNLEQEMMDMATVGMKYNVLSTLEGKSINDIRSAIKGE